MKDAPARGSGAVVLACAAALLAALAWRHMDLLGDSFWTLADGRRILAMRALPSADPFAFTSVHAPMILHMPATQIAFAWVAARAGLGGVLVLATLAVAAALLAVWLGFSRGALPRACTFPLTLVIVWVLRDDLCARGQVFGDVAFAAMLLLLDRADRGEPHAALPLMLGALWANVHPSFLLGIALPVAAAVASLADRPGERMPVRGPLRIAGLVAAGTLLNPYGWRLHADVLRLFRSPSTATLDLFRSPDFGRPEGLVLVIAAVVAMGLRARFGPAAGRVRDVLVTALLLAMACVGRRYDELLGLWDLALVGTMATSALDDRPGAARALGWRVAAPVAAGMAAASVAFLAAPKDALAQVPADATAFIEREHLPDHVFAPYHWGGYLDWAWDGRRKVFIDGRNNLFENGVFDDAHTVWVASPGWPAVLDAYSVETVIAERGSRLHAALASSGRWTLAFTGRLAVVYVRAAPRPQGGPGAYR